MIWETLFSLTFLTAMATAAVRMATPLLLAGLGGLFSDRCGLVNLGLEGFMITGALAGMLGSHYTGSPWLGLLIAMLAAAAFSTIFAFSTVTLGVSQHLTGTALNFLALGLTGFFFRAIFGITTSPVKVMGFKPVAVPLLSRLPFLGPALFSHVPLVYVALLLVPLVHIMLFRTKLGLAMRSAGEHPRALDTVGVDVFKIRWLCVLICGALSGAGGAYLSLADLSMFTEQMTAGRGFIALAAIVLGKWTPAGILGASLLFGGAEALQLRLQALGVKLPHEFALMLPYFLTMVALAGFIGRAKGPAALGKPYIKGEK